MRDDTTRSFVGTLGERIRLVVNYFHMKYQSHRDVYRYSVKIGSVKRSKQGEVVLREIKSKYFL